MSVDTLRDIIGCTCSFNETYDGKSYNLKTEQYEDCRCIETLPQVHSLLISKLPEKKELESYESPWGKTISDEDRDSKEGYNSAIDDMKAVLDEMFEVNHE